MSSEKQIIFNLGSTNVDPNTAKLSLAKAVPPAIATKYERQELYLNKVGGYYKDKAARTKKINYMIQERYNGAEMYGVDGLLKPSNYNAMRDFIGEMRAKGIKRAGMAYSSKGGIDDMIRFNASSVHTSAQTKIDNTITEFEPWVNSSGVSWPDFFALMEYAQAKTYNAAHTIETRSYEGHPNKPTGTNIDRNVDGTIDGVDIPGLHVYTFGKPAYSFLRPRLLWFGKRAMVRGFSKLKKLTILPIFSAEQEFGFAWFKANHPTLAMDNIVANFEIDSFPGKECLDLTKGFLMFKESDISQARPLRP